MILSLTFARNVIIAAVCLAFVSGCGWAHREQPVRIVETLIPVPVSCVPEDFPPPPEYPDPEQAQDRAEWLALTLSGDELRRDRLADVEAVIQGCR